jgi:hypothetical protein
MIPKEAASKYSNHKSNAAKRGIEWRFTPETWWQVWQESGRWEQKGVKHGGYVMARNWDGGPYAPWNVTIQLQSENLRTVMYRRIYRRGFQKSRRSNDTYCISYPIDPLQLLINAEDIDEIDGYGC